MAETEHESKIKLVDAAVSVVRAKGYAAARVDDICAAAGLTKGSFFHHFDSKGDLALAAVERWGATTANLFAATAYRELPDPLDRLLAYVDFRKALIRGEPREFTCFAGTTVQEVHETHPAIRDACGETILGHAATLEADIAAAMRQYGAAGTWTARSLALHTQAVIQGAFVLAKATQDPTIAIASLDHLRRYLELLFRPPSRRRRHHDNRTSAQSDFARRGRDPGAVGCVASGPAHHDKDAAAIAAAYTDDAIICDLAPPLYHRGVDVKEKQAWLDSWEGPIDLEPRDFSLTISGDIAYTQGYLRMSGTPKAAGRPVSFWLRDTICVNRVNGAWKIVHLHSSVPFYMDGSLRPAFDLQP